MQGLEPCLAIVRGWLVNYCYVSKEVAMRVGRGMSQALCIMLLLLSCCTLSAQSEEHRVRNIVLVHGA
jgi:hypothetical protein